MKIKKFWFLMVLDKSRLGLTQYPLHATVLRWLMDEKGMTRV